MNNLEDEQRVFARSKRSLQLTFGENSGRMFKKLENTPNSNYSKQNNSKI